MIFDFLWSWFVSDRWWFWLFVDFYLLYLYYIILGFFFTLLDYWLTVHSVDCMICARSVSSLSHKSASLFSCWHRFMQFPVYSLKAIARLWLDFYIWYCILPYDTISCHLVTVGWINIYIYIYIYLVCVLALTLG